MTRGKIFRDRETCYFRGPISIGILSNYFFRELIECLLDIAPIIVIERLIAFNRATRTVHFVPFVRGVLATVLLL